MKDLAIFSLKFIFFILFYLQKPQQSNCSYICFVPVVVNLKMVSEKLLGLVDLSRAQTFCIHEVTKVVVIYEDKHFVLAIFQIMMLCLKSFDNS